MFRDFPGGPVVKNSPSNAWDTNSILGLGAKISHAVGSGQNFFKIKKKKTKTF